MTEENTEVVVDPPVVDDSPVVDDAPVVEDKPVVEEKPKTAEEMKAGLAAAITEAIDTDGGKKKVEKPVVEEVKEEDAEKDEAGLPKRDPVTGKFLPKAKADVKPDAKAADKTGLADKAADKAADKKVKKEDVVNDPIDPSLSERTQVRMRGLIEKVKFFEGKAAESQQLFQHIADTGTSPENFGNTISYLRLYNSKDPADTRKAYDIALAEAKGLALKLGIEVEGTDFVAEHQDLKDAVVRGSMTRAQAHELAVSRNRTKHAETQRQTTEQATRQQREYETAKTKAITDLNTLGQTLGTDPDYARKYEILVPALKPVFARLHPSQWQDAFKQAYAELKLPAATRQQQQQQQQQPVVKEKGPQPLRPKQPAGQGKKQAGSLAEAVNNALDELNG